MIEALEYSKEGVKTTFTGLITSKEILNANNKIKQMPDFKSLKFYLWIFQAVENIKLNAIDIKNIVNQDIETSKTNPEVKVAIVSESPLIFELGRMYETFAGAFPWKTIVFYNLKEAEDWIES